jgi:hypothetical protein
VLLLALSLTIPLPLLRFEKLGNHQSASSSHGSSCRTAFLPLTDSHLEIGTSVPPAPYARILWKLRTTSLRNADTHVGCQVWTKTANWLGLLELKPAVLPSSSPSIEWWVKNRNGEPERGE